MKTNQQVIPDYTDHRRAVYQLMSILRTQLGQYSDQADIAYLIEQEQLIPAQRGSLQDLN